MAESGARWAIMVAVLVGCADSDTRPGPDPDASPAPRWETVLSDLPGALLSVWGSSSDDVWTVGGATEDGKGTLILHYDGRQWQRFVTGLDVDLWWVHGFADGSVLFGGEKGTLVRYDERGFARIASPETASTVFGVWGNAPDDVWVVGGGLFSEGDPFVWRYDGVEVQPIVVPDTEQTAAFFKVWGTSADNVWIVGTEGTFVHYDGAGWKALDTQTREQLSTVHAIDTDGPRVATVGGLDLGLMFEGTGPSTVERVALPPGARQLFGVWLTGKSGGVAVGADAGVLRRSAGGWQTVETGLETSKPFHAVWVDPEGGVWAVGGDVLVAPLGAAGVLVHEGEPVSSTIVEVTSSVNEPGTPVDASDASRGDRDGGPRDAATEAQPPTAGDGGSDGPSSDPPDAEPDAAPDVTPPPPRTPGTIGCGAAECNATTEVCCIGRDNPSSAVCADATTACPTGSFAMSCDQGADCRTGEVCCLRRFLQGGGINSVECLASCSATLTVCDSNADCTGTACSLSSLLTGYGTCQ